MEDDLISEEEFKRRASARRAAQESNKFTKGLETIVESISA